MKAEFSDEIAEALAYQASKLTHVYTYRGVVIDESWSKEALLNVARTAMAELVGERESNLRYKGLGDELDRAVKRRSGMVSRILGCVAVFLLCASSASAQWSYVPIEQSRSYNAYRGPYNGGYPMYPRFVPVYYRGGYYTSRYPEIIAPGPRTFSVMGSNGVYYWGSY